MVSNGIHFWVMLISVSFRTNLGDIWVVLGDFEMIFRQFSVSTK